MKHNAKRLRILTLELIQPSKSICPFVKVLLLWESFFFFKFYYYYFLIQIYFNWRLITLQYCSGFAVHWHESIRTCVPHSDPPSHLPPHTIPLGHPSAPAPSTLYCASNLDWRSISHMIIYMFQCHSPKSSHPPPLTQSPKDCALHLGLLCCLTCRVIVTIFLNSIYMH